MLQHRTVCTNQTLKRGKVQKILHDPEICSSFKNCISMQTNANNSYRVVFPVVALQPIRETLLLDWAKHRFEFSRHFPTLTLLKANSQRRPKTTSKPNATC